MGDRAYTRFSLPLHALTADTREHVRTLFGLAAEEVDALLICPPLPLEAGYDNATAVRLVQGCPCLVIEDDQANHGGSFEEGELENSGIPFLRQNAAGAEYAASQTVFNGHESISIRLDDFSEAIVGVAIDPDGTVAVNEEELDDLRRFVVLCKQVLTVA